MPRKKATLCFWCESEYDPDTFKCTKIDNVLYWICDKCTEWSVQTHMKLFLKQHPEFFDQTCTSKKELKKENVRNRN